MQNNPYKPPETDVDLINKRSQYKSSNEKIKRGGWLTGFLILAFIGSFITSGMYVLKWHILASIYPAWFIHILTGIAIFRFFTVLAIWFWSKSGVVAYVLLSVFAEILLVSHGQKISLAGTIGAVILIILVWPKWKYMKWGVSLG